MSKRKPSPNSLQGFVRTDADGNRDSTKSEYIARRVFGLTDVQVALCKAGDTITLKSGRSVKWKE